MDSVSIHCEWKAISISTDQYKKVLPQYHSLKYSLLGLHGHTNASSHVHVHVPGGY